MYAWRSRIRARSCAFCISATLADAAPLGAGRHRDHGDDERSRRLPRGDQVRDLLMTRLLIPATSGEVGSGLPRKRRDRRRPKSDDPQAGRGATSTGPRSIRHAIGHDRWVSACADPDGTPGGRRAGDEVADGRVPAGAAGVLLVLRRGTRRGRARPSARPARGRRPVGSGPRPGRRRRPGGSVRPQPAWRIVSADSQWSGPTNSAGRPEAIAP